MANVEGADLKRLFSTTFDWLVQNGESVPASGLDPGRSPDELPRPGLYPEIRYDGLPIVYTSAHHSVRLSGAEVWMLDTNAAQILGIDEQGALEINAFEPSYSYSADGWYDGSNLVYNEAHVIFTVEFPESDSFQEMLYIINKIEDGEFELDVERAYREGVEREFFSMTTNNTISAMTGMELLEGEFQQEFGALESIMNGLRGHWPAIKAARGLQATRSKRGCFPLLHLLKWKR